MARPDLEAVPVDPDHHNVGRRRRGYRRGIALTWVGRARSRSPGIGSERFFQALPFAERGSGGG